MKCGACRGRGYHKALRGLGTVECEKCGGDGEYQHKHTLGARTVSLGRPSGLTCLICTRRPAMDFHHAVSQSRIDNLIPDFETAQAAKGDLRDGVAVCRPCHDQIETVKPELVQPRHLHPNFLDYLLEYDLFAGLPRHLTAHYERRAA